jgi:hypothetical protein
LRTAGSPTARTASATLARAVDRVPGRRRDVEAREQALLGQAVLADGQRGGRRAHRTRREAARPPRRHVLELERDHVGPVGQPVQAPRVVERGDDVLGDGRGAGVGRRVEHAAAIPSGTPASASIRAS